MSITITNHSGRYVTVHETGVFWNSEKARLADGDKKTISVSKHGQYYLFKGPDGEWLSTKNKLYSGCFELDQTGLRNGDKRRTVTRFGDWEWPKRLTPEQKAELQKKALETMRELGQVIKKR